MAQRTVKADYRQILASIILVIVCACLWSGYNYYTLRQEQESSYNLGAAIAKMDLNSRISALEEVRSRFASTDAGKIANILLGQAYMEKEDWPKAAGIFKECTAELDGPMLDTAVMGHGYAEELQGNLDGALSDYKRAEMSAKGFEAVAILDQARIFAARKDKDQALSLYNRYLDLDPQSSLLDFIRYQILKLS